MNNIYLDHIELRLSSKVFGLKGYLFYLALSTRECKMVFLFVWKYSSFENDDFLSIVVLIQIV